MKIIIFCTKIIIAIVVALFATSCKLDLDNGIDGSGNVITETRTINEPFSKISVNSGIEVIVEQANNINVEVEADDNIIKHITTKVENGTLVISTDEDIDSAEKEIVRVKMPTIQSLETTSGSNISSSNTLKGTSLVAKSSSGSEIEIAVEYDNVKTESTSGSEITLSGKALSLSTSSSSGSQINAESLLANNVNSQSTSGSSTDVHPLVKLTAKASSGSSIGYDGTPKNIEKEETSGGSVSAN